MGCGNTKQVESTAPEPGSVAFREPGEAAPPPQAPPRTEEQGRPWQGAAEKDRRGGRGMHKLLRKFMGRWGSSDDPSAREVTKRFRSLEDCTYVWPAY